MTLGRHVRSKRSGERAPIQFLLNNGWWLFAPAFPRKGDKIKIEMHGKGRFGRPETVEAVVASDTGVESAQLESAFDTLSAVLLGRKCKSVLLRDNGEIIFGLDVDLYADLKERLGYGSTPLPLNPREEFRHGKFLFCIYASHAHQRPRDPNQPLS